MAYNKQRLNCEGVISSGSEITIDTQNAWQHLINITAGDNCNGLSVVNGSSTAITAFADAGSGQVTVTAAGHGIDEDDYISITGTTNYNGLFQITNVTTDTFEITDTWVSDDGTGTVRHGTHVIIPSGGGGDYMLTGNISSTASGANTTFEFTTVLGTTTNGLSRRKFTTTTDVGNSGMLGFFHAEAGDHIAVAIRNITSSTDITINEAQFVIAKIS